MTLPLVIIGTGFAGYSLAKEWRKLDSTTSLIMITEDDGCFYSKPQLSVAYAKKKSADALAMHSASAMAEQLNATILTMTSCRSINTELQHIQLDGQVISYSKLVFACGAKPRALTATGDAVKDVLHVNSLMDYRHVRSWLVDKKRIAIIGAGLVGMELANDWGASGYHIDMAETRKLPLASLLPEALSRTLKDVFAERGVAWSLGHEVADISYASSQIEISLQSGAPLVVDGVVSATGLVPNTELAQAAGLTVEKGIVVDKSLQASVTNVYAIGDCAEVAGQWRAFIAPILLCARVLAKTLVGEEGQVEYPVMPVIAKLPWCNVVVVLPEQAEVGTWEVIGSGLSQKALFYNQQQQLKGFALLGDTIHDRMALQKQIMAVS